jgi:hypothetical protein
MEADMNKKALFLASLLALFAISLTVSIALAHTIVHAGNYEIEVGWLDEPPLVGQRNAVLVNVSDTTAVDKEVDVSKLVVNITYGGETKSLTLQPLSEDTKNQYVAPIIPTIPGEYTVQLRGKLGDTDVNLDVQPEEVATADTLAFPSTSGAGQRGAGGGFRLGDWIAIGALVIALAALVLGFVALKKNRS